MHMSCSFVLRALMAFCLRLKSVRHMRFVLIVRWGMLHSSASFYVGVRCLRRSSVATVTGRGRGKAAAAREA
jgi:hypothetical protein